MSLQLPVDVVKPPELNKVKFLIELPVSPKGEVEEEFNESMVNQLDDQKG